MSFLASYFAAGTAATTGASVAASGFAAAATGTAATTMGATAAAAGAWGGASAIGAGLTASQILTGVGTGLQFISLIEQGNAMNDAFSYNAQLATQNSRIARQQAAENERRFRIRTRKTIGGIRAAYAKSGVTLEGSPSDILEESAYIAELDALTIRAGGEQSAQAYEAEARLAKLQGKSIQRGSRFTAAGTLVRGASNLLT